MLALELWLLLWLLPTRRATLRQGALSQARQANQGKDSQMALKMSVMVEPDGYMIGHKARLLTKSSM